MLGRGPSIKIESMSESSSNPRIPSALHVLFSHNCDQYFEDGPSDDADPSKAWAHEHWKAREVTALSLPDEHVEHMIDVFIVMELGSTIQTCFPYCKYFEEAEYSTKE